MLRRLPISVRLSLWYGLTLLVLLSAFAVFCYTGFHLALHRDFDRHLTHEQRVLLPFVKVSSRGPTFQGLSELTSVAYQTQGVYGTYVRLFTQKGELQYQSPNFGGYPPLPVVLPTTPAEASVSRVWNGLPARTRYVPLQANGTPTAPLAGWLELTGFEWSLHQELHQLRFLLILGVLGSVLLSLVGGWWMARRTLRPMATMTAAAGRMSARDLSARLPADFGTRDELMELAETFNAFLSRLEHSVERERRFTANAAHELLTPLAALRSEAEVTLRRKRDASDYRTAIECLLGDLERMTATVQGLLQLARADALARRPDHHLDFPDLVKDRVRHYRTEALTKNLTLETSIAPSVTLAAQTAPLTEVLDNLLANAVKYTPPGGRIHVRLDHADGEAVLRVTDTGVGFAPAEGDRLFDRFYRSDAPAVQAEQGSGLGLAIVKAIVEGYGGTACACSKGPGMGATFEVRLPCLT